MTEQNRIYYDAKKDLDELKDDILNGKKVDDIRMETPIMYNRYHRTLRKIEKIYMNKKKIEEYLEGNY